MTAAGQNRIFETSGLLVSYVSEWLCDLTAASAGRFSVCLSGGSTPKRLYQHFADPPLVTRFPWNRIHWFWGDERFVPHDHPDSNYKMAFEAFLSRAPVPPANIHAIPTEGVTPEQSAAAYETTLKQFYGSGAMTSERPLFDVTLLGIGDDGHTASLFPGQPALQETRKWAMAVVGVEAVPRVTLTYPALDSSRNVAFLATGDGKRDVIARAQHGDRSLPASKVRPIGCLHWFIDRAATPAGAM